MIIVKGKDGLVLNPLIIKVVNVPFGGARIMAKNAHGSVWSDEVTRESASRAINAIGNSMKTTGVDTDNWYLDLMDGHLKINRLTENGWKLEENNESDLNQKDTEESGS